MFRKNNLGDEIDYQNLRRSKEYRPLGEDYRERGLRTGDPSETANSYHL